MAQFKKLSDVELVEQMPEGATQLIVDNDEIKQVPASAGGGGGAGSITLALIEYLNNNDESKRRPTYGCAQLVDAEGKSYTSIELMTLVKEGYSIDLLYFPVDYYKDGILLYPIEALGYLYGEYLNNPFDCPVCKIAKMINCSTDILVPEPTPTPSIMLNSTIPEPDTSGLEDKDSAIKLIYKIDNAIPTFIGPELVLNDDTEYWDGNEEPLPPVELLQITGINISSEYFPDNDVFMLTALSTNNIIPLHITHDNNTIYRAIPTIMTETSGYEWYENGEYTPLFSLYYNQYTVLQMPLNDYLDNIMITFINQTSSDYKTVISAIYSSHMTNVIQGNTAVRYYDSNTEEYIYLPCLFTWDPNIIFDDDWSEGDTISLDKVLKVIEQEYSEFPIPSIPQ